MDFRSHRHTASERVRATRISVRTRHSQPRLGSRHATQASREATRLPVDVGAGVLGRPQPKRKPSSEVPPDILPETCRSTVERLMVAMALREQREQHYRRQRYICPRRYQQRSDHSRRRFGAIVTASRIPVGKTKRHDRSGRLLGIEEILKRNQTITRSFGHGLARRVNWTNCPKESSAIWAR